jgi:hypothetical protein
MQTRLSQQIPEKRQEVMIQEDQDGDLGRYKTSLHT